MESFLAKNGTEINYNDAFIPKSKITGAGKDSITALPKGARDRTLSGRNQFCAGQGHGYKNASGFGSMPAIFWWNFCGPENRTSQKWMIARRNTKSTA